MTRKILAALAALAMCMGAAGCANTEEGGESPAEPATAAAESSAAEGEDAAADEGGDSQSSEGGQPANTNDFAGDGEVRPTYGYGVRLTSDNIIYFNESDSVGGPTDEELTAMTAAAAVQYRAAASRDMQAFLDSFDLDSIREPMTDMIFEGRDVLSGDEFDEFIAGRELKYEVMNDIAELLDDAGDEGVLEEIGKAVDADYDETARLINLLFDSMTADREYGGDAFRLTVWDDEDLRDMSDLSENVTYAVIVYRCESHEGEMYCNFDMMVIDDGYEYYIDDVDAWCIGGEYGVFAHSSGWFDDDGYVGMTAQEIYEQMLGEKE